MFVNEYYSKFLELMRFAPEIVPSETLKAQRFEQGLTLTLHRFESSTFSDSLGELFIRLS